MGFTHMWVMNKIDLARSGKGPADGPPSEPMAISALNGIGVPELVTMIRDRLVPPADLADPGPWVFDPRLRALSSAP